MLKPKKITLPNRLRLVVAPMKSTEAVTVLIMCRAGSRYETKNINGIAHFLEHMFFKGGDRYPTPRSVSEAIDSIGGVFNAFTGDEYVGYYVKVAKDKIETAFDVLSDMLLNAKFAEDGLERERGVILEEYNMYEDTPMMNIGDEFEKLLFGDQPLGWSTIGLKPVIRKVKRQDFVDYKDRFYTASNLVVSVAGNITPAQVNKLVGKYLPIKKSTQKNQPLPFSYGAMKKRSKVIYKKTEQAHFVLGVPTPHYRSHPNVFVSQVMAAVLGGGMSSRLFTSIREQHGLAYYVKAYDVNYTDAGYLIASAGVDVKRIDLAVKTVLDEFRALITTPIPKAELNKAKELMIGRTVLGLEDSEAVANSFAVQELLDDKIRTINDTKKQIRAVTSKQIQDLAKQIFKDKNLHLAIIGPYQNDTKIKSVFKL